MSAEVHQVVLGNELLALGAFARTGRAKQDDIVHEKNKFCAAKKRL
jgi:hypothetical protein